MAFNLMLLFLPLASLLYLDTYEKQLLETQESSMIQQGRILASALSGADLASESARVLGRLGWRVDSRLRVVDREGRLLADSAAVGHSDSPGPTSGRSPYGSSVASSAAGEGAVEGAGEGNRGGSGGAGGAGGSEAAGSAKAANEHFLYRAVVYPLNAFRKLFFPPSESYGSGDYYSGKSVLLGPEVLAALGGRYGSTTRLSTGGQVSVNLYSAIPIPGEETGDVVGAVLVSRSTYSILVRLYEFRLDIIRIFMFSLLAAMVLSLALSMTITAPIRRLRTEAETVLDRSGRFTGRFSGSRRKDEIGDLSRSLSELSSRLEKRTAYIDGFTADLLHELKNPLAAIRGAAELALAPPPSAGEGADAGAGENGSGVGAPGAERTLLAGIRDEELRMERLLAGLRELGGIDNRMDGEALETVDLARLVPVALSRYPHPGYPDVRVSFEDAVGRPALVRVNPDRLVQIVANPVDNAVSFSPPGSAVTVRLAEAPGGYAITVDDEGPGLLESSRLKAFDRFYSDRPEGDRDSHSGLGLAIVKAVVSGYGGACSIENGPGGGCRFTAALPGA
ncbi:MAG: HAMP domain-containing protein [Spirochaetes bacterium]|nr:HAMP domain-containing protein [Spirochaetota bacterium]